jgi:hypothetical protein
LILVIAVKFAVHKFNFEVLELNALFTSLVAGTIFLIGFLISGVLSDYKESEKIPSDIAALFRTMYDDTFTIYKARDPEEARRFIFYQVTLSKSVVDWFYKRERTKSLLGKISDMNAFFIEMENRGIQANYIIKLKNEQVNLRKMILRVDTIRDTEFSGAAYAIVQAMTFLTAVGLILIKIEPFYTSLFLTLLVTFLITYMFMLIKDFDNPFDYVNNGERGNEVSLKPLKDYILEFESALNEEKV